MSEEANESLLSTPEENAASAEGSANEADKPAEGAANEWFYDEGVPGVGPKPEWFDGDKYKSVVDAAKGVGGLRQKLGAFTGAPDEYNYTKPEELGEVELNTEDPLYKDFSEFAKESNMSQSHFDKFVTMYLEKENLDIQNSEQDLKSFKADQINNLGENHNERITKLKNWVTSSIPEKYHKALGTMSITSEQIEALEFLHSGVGSSKMPGQNSSSSGGLAPAMEKSEIYKILRGEGELGSRYQRDKGFQEEISDMLMKHAKN